MVSWTLCVARWLQLSSTVVVCGSALFFIYGYSPAAAGDTDLEPVASWPRSLLLMASAIGVASAVGWLSAEAATLTGNWGAWHDVMSGTRMGRVLVWRSGLLALAFTASAAFRPGRILWSIVSTFGVLSIVSFAWTGHGSIGSGSAAGWHLCADLLHLLSAAVWIGALLPLSIVVLRAMRSSSCEPQRIARALARFSAIGPAVVAVLLLSGIANSWFLIGVHHWRALLHSAYGLTLSAKVLLFAFMLALAATHRYRITPALQHTVKANAGPDPIFRLMQTTLMSETILAGLVLVAVALLGTLEPPASIP